MKAIIPRAGDWVLCVGFEAPGKVTSVSRGLKTFLADFFCEYSGEDDVGGTAPSAVPFTDISKIITSQAVIEDLEKELRGEVEWP